MSTMKIAFYRAWAGGGSTMDKLVSLWTRSPYSHCELIFSDGTSFSSSSRDGGVRFKQVKYVSGRWDVMLFETEYEVEMRQWCDSQLGKKYDYLGILSHVIMLPFIQDNSRWYCSEICSAALQIGNFYCGKTTISPGCLFDILRNKKCISDTK